MFRYFVKKISFPFIASREGYPGVLKHLRELEASQNWPLERILNLQRARLKNLLVHAYENNLFYNKKFDEAGFNPYKFRHTDEMKGLPVLTKEEIHNHLLDSIARNYRENDLRVAKTGGTSGEKMVFYRDDYCLPKKEAALYRFEKWSGWDIGERIGLVWPARQDHVGHWTLKSKIKNGLYRREVVFPAAIIEDDLCMADVQRLLAKKPAVIRGYTTPLFELAHYMERKGTDDVAVKGIITTGEPLYPHQRKLISQVFHCPVFNSYGIRETGPIAQECHMHSGLHISAESVYLETDRASMSDEPEMSDLLVTDLLNYGMPLIRYRIGDVGSLSMRKCGCGCELPLLEKVLGRVSDTFYTPDGKKIMPVSLLQRMHMHTDPVGQIQFVQDRLDHILINLTRDPAPTQDLMDYMRDIIRQIFGDRMNTTYTFVSEIPREASGRYQYAKCIISDSGSREGAGSMLGMSASTAAV